MEVNTFRIVSAHGATIGAVSIYRIVSAPIATIGAASTCQTVGAPIAGSSAKVSDAFCMRLRNWTRGNREI
jgi:hypothetical protein